MGMLGRGRNEQIGTKAMKHLFSIAALPLLVGAADPMLIQPGKWQTTVTVIDMKMPKAPPGMAAAMKGRPMTTSHCVTAEQARQGPRAVLKADSGCRFTKYSAANGRIATTMVCNRPGGSMTAVSNGSYTPTSYQMTGQTTATGQMPMTMTSRAVGKRTGTC